MARSLYIEYPDHFGEPPLRSFDWLRRTDSSDRDAEWTSGRQVSSAGRRVRASTSLLLAASAGGDPIVAVGSVRRIHRLVLSRLDVVNMA